MNYIDGNREELPFTPRLQDFTFQELFFLPFIADVHCTPEPQGSRTRLYNTRYMKPVCCIKTSIIYHKFIFLGVIVSHTSQSVIKVTFIRELYVESTFTLEIDVGFFFFSCADESVDVNRSKNDIKTIIISWLDSKKFFIGKKKETVSYLEKLVSFQGSDWKRDEVTLL